MTTMRPVVLSLIVTAASLAPSLHGGSCCHPAPTAVAPALSDESIYHQPGDWVDQDNTPRRLADFAGAPVLISMVFTHCGYACPRTVEDIREVREALPPGVRERVRIVLASFDVARDTPERLRAWADLHGFDAGWTLLHGDEAAVRQLFGPGLRARLRNLALPARLHVEGWGDRLSVWIPGAVLRPEQVEDRLRLAAGIVLPIGATALAILASRASSLQASTGLLYIGLALIMAGSIAGASLTYLTGLPV